MTETVPVDRARRAIRGVGSVRHRAPTLGVAAGAIVTGVLVASPAGTRLAIGLGIGTLLFGLAVLAPRQSIYLLAGWLVVLGMVRRMTTAFTDLTVTADSLLTVGPVLFVILGGIALRAGALRERSRLASATLGLGVVLSLSALNPAQGGLVVGIAGLSVVVAPMLAFLVGRSLLSSVGLTRLLVVVAALAVPAAIYGLAQLFVGFPTWDKEWIDTQGYVALNLDKGVVRPFASFASGQEFGTYIAIGLVIVLAFSTRRRRVLTIPTMGLLAAAIWFESGRSIMVLTVLAIGLMVAARAGWGGRRAVLTGAAMLLALPIAIGLLAPGQFAGDASGVVGAHNVEGLSNPFGKDSTLPVHLAGLQRGVLSAVTDPLGRGVGAVTSAASRLGGQEGGTESDPGNATVAAGALGLVMYVAVVVIGFRRCYRLAASTRSPLAVASLGILAVTSLHWLTGGLYSVSWLPWLVLGWVDKETSAIGRGVDELEGSEVG